MLTQVRLMNDTRSKTKRFINGCVWNNVKPEVNCVNNNFPSSVYSKKLSKIVIGIIFS